MTKSTDDHAAFDPEPVTTLSPGEPLTPGWYPVVGAVLFVLVGVYFLFSGESEQAQPDRAAAVSQQAIARPPAPPAVRGAQRQAHRVRPRPPSGLDKLDPKARAELERKVEELRQRVGFVKNNHLPKK